LPTLPAPLYPVVAPTYLPPLHGLLASVPPTPDEPGSRWLTGFVVEPEGYVDVDAIPGAWCGSDYEHTVGLKPADGPPALVEYHPFQLVASYSCKFGRTGDERRDKVRRFLDLGASKAVERELWTGEMSDLSDTGNMRLAKAGTGGGGPTDLTVADREVVKNPGYLATSILDTVVPVSLQTGLSVLAQALADYGPGAKGMIHMTSRAGEFGVEKGMFVEDRQALRTKSRGDIVVVGSGYPGTGPGGDVPDDGMTWIHATSMVQVRRGEVVVLPTTDAEAINRHTGSWVVRAEQAVAAYWDGTFQASVLVDLSLGSDDYANETS
jgi:hypothetical protein